MPVSIPTPCIVDAHPPSAPNFSASRSPRYPSPESAGRKLADLLAYYRRRPNSIVLALNPESLPLATTVAGKLELKTNLMLVRFLESHSGITLGAVGQVVGREDEMILKEEIAKGIGLEGTELEFHIADQRATLRDMHSFYLTLIPSQSTPTQSHDSTILLLTNGIRRESEVRAALSILRRSNMVGRVIIASPVVGIDCKLSILKEKGVEIVALVTPSARNLGTMVDWYERASDFPPETYLPLLNLL
ncbi:uncharacterized protein VTP21DRAFT_9851 [Calcarisporiella thermophila]|uniref:uncharacterized protein n=1 Tax=Calcarisporiella thermophila TaxID=911321 RepID=UPI0037444699